ncbi:leucine-rich repeats and immunoglobulin-like domains protein sma-10 [Harmonia axyridis]|uniref:leucine-rich repeats and immunoglobulin-like domains protein sma-10 n=1 Tax=Harmonia axyridis TaxID=115357 RepID=UPI001E279A52|nr:leucine-rich repeats and immunoglobulin-like domains protein sma-10 [Harmonia axyridis]
MWFLAISLVSILSSVICDPVHIHLHPEVAIVDYNGPLHHEIFEIIRGVETLEIINSNITSMKGSMLAKLTKLKKIVFINCTVDVDGVDIENMFEGATNLKEFYARRIFARELRPEIVRKLAIEVFVMTDNNYPDLPGNLFNETKLKLLDLSENHLQTIDNEAFNGLSLLETLDLSTNELTVLSENVLKPLKNVKIINLSENKFTKFSVKDLPELKNLEELDLTSNPLQHLDLNGIETKTPKLKSIKISGTSIPEPQLKELKTAYPEILKSD